MTNQVTTTPTPPVLDQARDRREALGRAADVIEARLARPSGDPSWTTGVASAMDDLRSAFASHCLAVEAPDGLLAQLRADAPRLSPGIDFIKNDHVQIARSIDQACELVRRCGGACDREAIDTIRITIVDVLRAVSRHRQKGADLVYEAYNVDIGGG